MLKKISCNIFLQKEIVFHEGLNAIVGDDIASNSIGKSTMLMIIDFVFGGDDYISKNHDVVDNLGHHDFRFIFNFDNSDIDYETQLITFKDRNKSVDLYLIDFADLCIENFRIIFYVLELVYNLRKIDFIQKGIAPSFVASKIRVDEQQQKKKKIGRNEPCPCGSGKKYKRCCGK